MIVTHVPAIRAGTYMMWEYDTTILALGSFPGAKVIPLLLVSNSAAFAHAAFSVTKGIEVIPESSALTEKCVGWDQR